MSRFIKIAADGSQLPDDATGHVAVLEPARGLMWSVETLPRAVWEEAKANAAALQLLGHSDWRLPTVEELFGLADRSRYSPAIDTDAFPGTKSDWYWSASPDASAPADCAWIVGFSHGGYAYVGDQDGEYFVRPVRSVAAPASQ